MDYQQIEGDFSSADGRVAIIVSRWNAFITEKLKEGALDSLKRHGFTAEQIAIVYCPGSYEIPLTAKKLAETGKFDGIICLGAVIQGATPHFDYVCSAVNKGISTLNIELDIPVIFGVLTTNTIEQAIERAGTKAGNKGADAALAFIEMHSLLRNINDIT